MTPEEVGRFLAVATVTDPRVEVSREAVASWYALIGDLDAADAQQALMQHYRGASDRIMPADVRRRVEAMRRARVEAAPSYEELMADVDNDDPQWTRILQQRLLSLASGAEQPRELEA